MFRLPFYKHQYLLYTFHDLYTYIFFNMISQTKITKLKHSPSLSQSIIAAPSFSIRRAILDFPEPIPPVRPIIYGRFASAGFYNR
jgi:hypothetical protein